MRRMRSPRRRALKRPREIRGVRVRALSCLSCVLLERCDFSNDIIRKHRRFEQGSLSPADLDRPHAGSVSECRLYAQVTNIHNEAASARAIEIARAQELRASTSLARLWRTQRRQDDARLNPPRNGRTPCVSSVDWELVFVRGSGSEVDVGPAPTPQL